MKPTHEQLLAAMAVIEAAEDAAASVKSLPSGAAAQVEPDDTAAASDTTSQHDDVSSVHVVTAKVQSPHQVQLPGYLGPVWQKFE